MPGRFAINPGPLRVIPQAHRDAMTRREDPFAGRCEARLKESGWPCTRDGVREVNGKWLCTQHARIEERAR